jgi:hypothetical protein
MKFLIATQAPIDLDLPVNGTIVLGRGAFTQITQMFISRKHAELFCKTENGSRTVSLVVHKVAPPVMLNSKITSMGSKLNLKVKLLVWLTFTRLREMAHQI